MSDILNLGIIQEINHIHLQHLLWASSKS